MKPITTGSTSTFTINIDSQVTTNLDVLDKYQDKRLTIVHSEGLVRRTPRCKQKTGLITKDFTRVTCPACTASMRKDLAR